MEEVLQLTNHERSISDFNQTRDYLNELYQCILNFQNFKHSQSLQNFQLKLKSLEVGGNPEILRIIQELSKAEIDGFTLIQHCCFKEGLTPFLRALLDAHINPNEVLDGSSNKHNVNAGVLLAAENGHFEVLAVLIDYNKNVHSVEKEHMATFTLGKGLKGVRDQLKYKKVECYFDKWTEQDETILHLVLKRPLLKQLKDNNRSSRANFNDDFWNKLKLKAKALDEKYNKCIDVLLSNDFDGKYEDDDFTDSTGKQIRRIINMKDTPFGNTPLHYAVHNWPQNVIIRLLRFAANVAVKNNDGDIPLSHIRKDTIEKFLNQYCMDIPGFNQIGMVGDRDSTNNSIQFPPTLNDYDISMLLDDYKSEWISRSPVNFKFGFLSPAISESQLKQASLNSWELHILKEKNFELNSLKEMDVLTQICNSKEHKDLVIHPVLKAYTWIKWKLISKLYNRNLRVHILLSLFLTWYIFAQFGGRRWSFIRLFSKKQNNETQHMLVEEQFCPPEQEFNLFGNNSVVSAIWNWNKRERGHDWFIIFLISSIILLLWMLFDHRQILFNSNFGGFLKLSRRQQKLKLSNKITFLLLALFTDIFIIFLILLALIGSEEVLWFNIIILGTMQLIREVLQICSSVKKYFTQFDNYFDLLQISMIYLIVIVPNAWLTDTCRLSVGIDTDKCNMIKQEALENCTIKRCVSAWTIVSMWSRIVAKIARHPKLEKCNIYMSMFYQVGLTFFKFLLFYASFLIAYGLGFYIMLHHDISRFNNSTIPTDNKTETNSDAEGNTFNAPMRSLMNTAVMFLGEIDDLPTMGGNISQTLAYIFLLSFLFLMVMVLMNLLNGMAVSDTGKILQKSQVLGQTALIDTIAYSESVLLNNLTTLQRIGRKLPCFLTIVQRILLSSGAMLFESDYMKGTEELVLPLNKPTTFCNNEFCCKSIINWLRTQFDDDECDQIMFDARKIIEDNLSTIKNEVGPTINNEVGSTIASWVDN